MEEKTEDKVMFPGMKEVDDLIKRVNKTLEECRKVRKELEKLAKEKEEKERRLQKEKVSFWEKIRRIFKKGGQK